MAKGKITLQDLYQKDLNTLVVKFTFSCKSGYCIKFSDTYGVSRADSGSVRLYYDSTPAITSKTSGGNASPFTTVQMYLNQNTKELTSGGWECVAEVPVPSIGTNLVYFQLRMLLYNDDPEQNWNSTYKYYATYKSPIQPDVLGIKQAVIGTTQPLFQVATYGSPYTVTDEDGEHQVYPKDWIDFTDHVALPSYDVNYEDVNEDWEDANYFTHRIRVRSKVNGKLDLWFSDLTSYNHFIHLLKRSKECNGNGTAYVELRVQINDSLDEWSGSTYNEMRCEVKEGLFFVKLDNNPWVAPVFGHYDKYQAVSLSINEA